MKIEICDFCKKPLDNMEYNRKYLVNRKLLRKYLRKYHNDGSGMHWKEVDVCYKCFDLFMQGLEGEE